jgi:hypothetical protein
LVGTATAVAVNVAETVPAAMVTDAGTDSSPVLLERATVAPPAEAGWFSAAVQTDELPLLSDVGLHEIPVNAGNGTVMVPPVPATEIALPAAAAPTRLVSPTAAVTAEAVIVTLITATMPSWITVSFIPDSRHV